MNGQADRPETDNAGDELSGSGGEPAADAEASGQDSEPAPTRAELQAKADENWEKYLRAVAELENVRKRAARDVEHAHKFALERFATELIAVLDSLEQGLATGEDADAATLLKGKEATLKQLLAIMEHFGVDELDPQGEPFDPTLHEAMTMRPSAEAEPGSVVEVFQKGYALNGRLLRPARVVVASEAEDSAGARTRR